MDGIYQEIFDLSLYSPMKITEENYKSLYNFFEINTKSMQKFDSYCMECQKNTTFKMSINNNRINYGDDFESQVTHLQGIKYLKYECQRDEHHDFHLIYHVNEFEIKKIGQYPSIADLQIPSFNKYRKILKADYKDLTKAIGLNASGIGIGSYVYIRRIFENLINEAKDKALLESNLDLNEFNRAKMDQKVKLLETYLPNVLVENKKIYSIISKGIHELSEDECLEMFKPLLIGIELILDDKLAAKERESKESKLRSFVSNTVARLSNLENQ